MQKIVLGQKFYGNGNFFDHTSDMELQPWNIYQCLDFQRKIKILLNTKPNINMQSVLYRRHWSTQELFFPLATLIVAYFKVTPSITVWITVDRQSIGPLNMKHIWDNMSRRRVLSSLTSF